MKIPGRNESLSEFVNLFCLLRCCHSMRGERKDFSFFSRTWLRENPPRRDDVFYPEKRREEKRTVIARCQSAEVHKKNDRNLHLKGSFLCSLSLALCGLNENFPGKELSSSIDRSFSAQWKSAANGNALLPSSPSPPTILKPKPFGPRRSTTRRSLKRKKQEKKTFSVSTRRVVSRRNFRRLIVVMNGRSMSVARGHRTFRCRSQDEIGRMTDDQCDRRTFVTRSTNAFNGVFVFDKLKIITVDLEATREVKNCKTFFSFTID